jgi:hypothetical protein
MRSHHVIAIAAVLLVGFGVKLLFFPNRAAEAQSQVPSNVGMNVFQMHLEHPRMTNLPEQVVKEPF